MARELQLMPFRCKQTMSRSRLTVHARETRQSRNDLAGASISLSALLAVRENL